MKKGPLSNTAAKSPLQADLFSAVGEARLPENDERSPELPVAVFDSGVGGLTVLHELLVSLPAEDYVIYACDTCLPWHAEAFADDDGMVWVREWHAMDCPAFQELLAIADQPHDL